MYLSLCLIAKDENSYLAEWLDYHILMGVEHFWIYDNESKVPISDSISDYIKKGWVTIHEIKGKAMQLYAYDHCIQSYGTHSKWIGFIDTDEFIVPKTGENLCDFLRNYEQYGGVAISSLFFGSGGNKTRPKCGQIAGYQIRTPEGLTKNRLVKSIVQPEKTLLPTSPHSFIFSEGNFCVNELGHRVDTQFFSCSTTKIQLNHYYTRSEQEWKEKNHRGRGDSGQSYTDNNWVEIEKNSTVTDLLAINLVIQKINLPPSIAKNITALIDRYSDKFPKTISAFVKPLHPPLCSATPSTTIVKRKELINLEEAIAKASTFLDNKQFQEARNVYIGLIQQFPFLITYYIDFSIVCILQGDFEAAWEALTQAWKISPRNWTVLSCMIDYFYGNGNYEQAEKCTLLLNEYGSLAPINIAGLALAQWKQGKYDQSRVTAQYLIPQITPEVANSHIWFKELIELVKPENPMLN